MGNMLTKICAFYCMGCVSQIPLVTTMISWTKFYLGGETMKRKKEWMKWYSLFEAWNNLLLTWSDLFDLQYIYFVSNRTCPEPGRPEPNVSYSKNRMNDARYVLIVSCFTWTFLPYIRVVSLMLRLFFGTFIPKANANSKAICIKWQISRKCSPLLCVCVNRPQFLSQINLGHIVHGILRTEQLAVQGASLFVN